MKLKKKEGLQFTMKGDFVIEKLSNTITRIWCNDEAGIDCRVLLWLPSPPVTLATTQRSAQRELSSCSAPEYSKKVKFTLSTTSGGGKPDKNLL